MTRKPTENGEAYLAFARARQAGADGVLRPSSFDYPVIFNATGTYRITPRWDVSLRASALGGRPYTPVDPVLSAAQRRAVYDLSQVNAARGPAYVRIDVRVDRTFTIAGSTLAVFAGVQNVTNRDNLAGYSWDRRNNVLRADAQLGVFPILGREWRFGG